MRAVRSGPEVVADARAGLQVVGAVVGAPGQALEHLLVDLRAVSALPARLAIALAGYALSMARAVSIQAVLCADDIKNRKFSPLRG